MEINFLTIHTKDMEKSIAFYEKVLDFKLDKRLTPSPGSEIAFLDDGFGIQLELIKDPKEAVYKGQGISLGFYVKDIEHVRQHLLLGNVPITFGPVALKSGVKLMHAKDPNGLELGFVQK